MTDTRDFWERTLWTAISAALGALTMPAILSMDITVWESAAIAAGTVVINAATIFARQRSGQD